MAPTCGVIMPYIKMFDILGIATQKVLAVPTAMIDPKNRNIVSTGSSVFIIGCNRSSSPRTRFQTAGNNISNRSSKGKNSWSTFAL